VGLRVYIHSGWERGLHSLRVRLWVYIHSEWDCGPTFTPSGTVGLHSLRVRLWAYIHSEWDYGSTFIPSGTLGLHSLLVGLWVYIHPEWDCESTFTPSGTLGLHSLRVGLWVYIHSAVFLTALWFVKHSHSAFTCPIFLIRHTRQTITLTEGFPCLFPSCKANANARVQIAKTGHGPHSSQLVNCVVLCVVCFVSFSVLFVCKCVLSYCHRVATQLQSTNISYQNF
jgi:hypothetical protein